jgi:hypothetical protein
MQDGLADKCALDHPMGLMMDKLFPALMMLGLVSPIAAIAAAFILYARHRDRVEPERRVPAIWYVLAVFICGAIGGTVGLFFGIEQACYGPEASNLCGLWGFFVTGPISFSLAIVLVGLLVSSVRPAPKPDDGNSH